MKKKYNEKKDQLSMILKKNNLKINNHIENENTNNNNKINLFEVKNERQNLKIHNPFIKKEPQSILNNYDDNKIDMKSIDSNLTSSFLKKKTIHRKKNKNKNLQSNNIIKKEKKQIINKKKRKKKEIKSKELIFFLINKSCSNILKKDDIISLFALMILRESDRIKKNILTFSFISKKNKKQIISNYNKNNEKELIDFQNYINNNNNSSNLELNNHKEKENLFFGFQEISKIYNDNIICNNLICLYCFQYFGDLKKHYFLKRKKKTYCEIFISLIIKENNINEQINLFIDVLKYSKPVLRSLSNELLINEIFEIINLNKINIPFSNINDTLYCFEIIYSIKFGYEFNYTMKKLKKNQENIILNFKKEKQDSNNLIIQNEENNQNKTIQGKNHVFSILENQFSKDN